ncbi:2-polyprenyl-6-methoxyphenol hydroxylase-like FAD-dependent oxidoreductase [Actinoplanes octamycinicus]|uniref:2-polyprenyl-6-methoxyphenol hydroxylase-like FAD-dependent oxidoreductase n=1 Tax=Actinoplanes octamycinicus TaxID=135948 RepID=A0A7W7MAR1_9ACTN|nr:FAD-dependent monooxygenase [Actinoplanes octamycinicus]MBB4743344.1 2-polyprenyl-6-methoxyphenol hydroxylase-like FAD-dependent oxidoreductase [Actinoplanes octamycinicus]GIE61860.1 FAD-dependent oxidoreductase [Actinoplanes octamycinicus]
MTDDETPVLIVGGSLAGLSSALFLAHQGIRPLLVERHPRISAHPRAQAASPRTMELLDAIGLGDEVRAAETPNAQYGDILQVESLAGKELGRFDGPFRHDTHGVSRTGWTLIGQDRLEPILRARAEQLGADIRFGTELVGHTQDADGVTAVIRGADGAERTVRAKYLIAADGHRSPIRAELGIGTTGRGTFGRQMIILFRADLEPLVAGRKFFLCFVSNPDVHGVLGQLGAAGTRLWCLAPSLRPEDGHQEYPPERCVELVRAAAGVPDLPLTVTDASSWEIAARVAERFRAGRVFLVGDSAHVMPPTGGFGGNMGLQDAHNLAWKLALVLRGTAAPSLLDTYEPERLPVAEFTVEQGVIRYLQRSGLDPEVAARHQPEATVLFGHRYRSAAVLTEDDDPAVVEDPREASGRPGTRAPYLPLRHGDREVSLADLVHRDFTLVAAAGGDAWLAAGEKAGIPLDRYLVGADLIDPAGQFPARYGVGDTGAVLIRPDGFVAWRAPAVTADPVESLRSAVARLLGHE